MQAFKFPEKQKDPFLGEKNRETGFKRVPVENLP